MARKSQYRFKKTGPTINWALIACIVLLVLIGLTQYALWFGERSIPSLVELNSRTKEQVNINEEQGDRNAKLKSDVYDLQTGEDAIEERARSEMGLIKEGETFIYYDDETEK